MTNVGHWQNAPENFLGKGRVRGGYPKLGFGFTQPKLWKILNGFLVALRPTSQSKSGCHLHPPSSSKVAILK
jgi:hypothetical protein